MNDAERLGRIKEIIEMVDIRCEGVDGPVTPTLKEMRQEEISEIYMLATLSSNPSPKKKSFFKGSIGPGVRTFDIGKNLSGLFTKIAHHMNYQYLDEHTTEFERLVYEALGKNYRGVEIEILSSEGGSSATIHMRLLKEDEQT